MAIAADSGIDQPWSDARSWRDDVIRWSIAASLALHIVLGIGADFYPVARPIIPPEPGVAVRILTREEFETATSPSVRGAPAEPSREAVPPSQPAAPSPSAGSAPLQPDAAAQPGGMIRATQFFSASVLAESGSRQVRATLPLLAKEDRITQLCNIEAVEQIHRWRAELQPDYVVTDAMADTRLRHLSLEASGGAFRSEGNWYSVKYRCTVTPNLGEVSSFEFLVGPAIPKQAWKKYHLVARDTPGD